MPDGHPTTAVRGRRLCGAIHKFQVPLPPRLPKGASGPLAPDQRINRSQIARDRPVVATLSATAAVRDRHVDRILVDIQSDVGATLLHDLPPCIVALCSRAGSSNREHNPPPARARSFLAVSHSV